MSVHNTILYLSTEPTANRARHENAVPAERPLEPDEAVRLVAQGTAGSGTGRHETNYH
jgi:hypothetical protein